MANGDSNHNDKKSQMEIGRWIAIGLALGAGIGVVFDSIPLGMAIGLAIGSAVGTLRSRRNK